MRYFTSDTHFGHERIIELCNRPFKDVDHMNSEIVRRWNEVVMPDDVVFHLGDVALGQIANSLPIVGRLNGVKILVVGNHDRLFSTYSQNHRARFASEYAKVFDDIIGEEGVEIDLSDESVAYISHFPYDGDSHGTDRHVAMRPVDNGYTPLIHGHTHMTDILTYSSQGTPQIHVGVDAWNYTPVSEDAIIDILDNA